KKVTSSTQFTTFRHIKLFLVPVISWRLEVSLLLPTYKAPFEVKHSLITVRLHNVKSCVLTPLKKKNKSAKTQKVSHYTRQNILDKQWNTKLNISLLLLDIMTNPSPLACPVSNCLKLRIILRKLIDIRTKMLSLLAGKIQQ